MAHPLFHLAARLEKRRTRARTLRAQDLAQTDPHLARDVGLHYRPAPKVRVEQW